MRRTLKALSLDQQVEAARRAVYRALEASRRGYYGDGYRDDAYPIYVYPDYVIVQEGIQYFKVPYTVDAAGVTVPPRAEWTTVEQTWKSLPILDAPADTLVTTRTGAVKALGNGKVGGYLVQFSTADDPDLSGEFFTAETDFDVEDGDKTAVYYHHGMDATIKTRKIGTGTIKKDAIGVWVEAQLAMRDTYEKQIYKLAEQGKLGWSSGTAVHLAEYKPAGKATEITRWPLGLDASLTPTPAEPRTRVLPLKSYDPPQATLTGPEGYRSSASAEQPPHTRTTTMDPEEIKRLAAEAARAAVKAYQDEQAAAAQAAADEKARTDAAVKAALDAAAKEWAKGNRLADGGGVEVGTPLKFSEVAKFDGLDAGDMALMISILDSHHRHNGGRRPSEAAYKALAIKLDESQTKTGEHMRQVFKSWGVKANEVMYSTLASFGDEWVFTTADTSLWESIRQGTFVLQMIPQREIPQGSESITIPLEGSDPTWYKVPQTTSINSTTGRPDATVPSSRVGTGNKVLSASKMGARALVSGELEEDSVIAEMPNLRRQFASSGAEMLEHAVIDGDTDATASTNINDIAGTPAATDLFLLIDGFRKLALITNTANKRAGGTLTSGDFLATARMLGAAGVNALDTNKVGLISDVNTHYTALELADVKSRDVFTQATIESGKLTGLYGYKHHVSPWMHYMSAARMANTAGKIDQDTTANNTTGSILAVRWDQWVLGWKRRMTMETQRFPDADTTQLVALARVGLAYRDTEAAAISYGITLS